MVTSDHFCNNCGLRFGNEESLKMHDCEEIMAEPEDSGSEYEILSDDELFSENDEIENNTTNQNLQTEPSVKDKINENVKSNEERNNEVPNREGRPQEPNRTAHERFTREEKLEARSRSRRPLTPQLAETFQNDPQYAYEVYDDRRVINPMNHEIIDGGNKERQIEEDTPRKRGGLPTIGGKLEWRQAAEKRKRKTNANATTSIFGTIRNVKFKRYKSK